MDKINIVSSYAVLEVSSFCMDLSLVDTTMHVSPLLLQFFPGNAFISFFGAISF